MKNLHCFKCLMLVGVLVFIAACSSEKKQETKAPEEPKMEEKKVEISGYASIEEMSTSIIEAFKNNDYDDYYSHVMSKELEESQAARIESEEGRKAFKQEFGFSLAHEEEEFKNLLNYLKQENIDLEKSQIDELVLIDYRTDEFIPLELKQVIIPVIHDGMETDLIYVAIKVEDTWFLTSELQL